MPDGVLPVVAQQVGVAVAREAPRAFAQRHKPASVPAGHRHLKLANRGLVIGQAKMLRPVLRRHVDRHAGRQRAIDHRSIDALRVQIDLDAAAAARDAVEHGLPEVVAALRDAALAVNAEGDGRYGGAGAQHRRQRVAAVRGVRLVREALDKVSGVGTPGELVSVHPDAKLELEPAGDSLVADEAQHLEVAVALRVRQVRDAHVVAGHVDEERIEEQQVAVGDLLQEVVAEAEGQMEPVEAVAWRAWSGTPATSRDR